MKPTFVGIGAQKCASSWIYDILSDHPEVCVSERKEINYFTHYYDNGQNWYENHFRCKSSARAVGEISPSYFHESSAPGRVKRYLPNARILVSLRDPVERALSQHRHLVRIGVITGPDLSFESGLENNPSYVEQCLYATHLARWLDQFGLDNTLVVLMDDIRSDAVDVARNIYRFLGVSVKHHSSALMKKSNPSYAVRNRGLEDAVKFIRSSAKRIGLKWVWDGIGNTGLRRFYRAMNRTASEKVIPEPKPETLARLRKEFATEVDALEKLLGRDLSAWKQM